MHAAIRPPGYPRYGLKVKDIRKKGAGESILKETCQLPNAWTAWHMQAALAKKSIKKIYKEYVQYVQLYLILCFQDYLYCRNNCCCSIGNKL